MSKETGPTVGELTRYKRPENVLLMPDASGEFVLYETAEAKLTRLRGEVEKLRATKLEIYQELRDTVIEAETAEARVQELEAEVERLKGLQSIIIETKEMWENIATEHAETINTLRAQLADYEQKFKVGNELHMEVKAKLWKTEAQLTELRAMVRPSVEELLDKISIAQRAWAEQDAYPTPHGFARSFNEHLAIMLKDVMGGEE